MEAKLARTNQEFRYKKPIAQLMREADKAWRKNVDVLLWGHFHTSWQYRAGWRTAMVVPAWLESRDALLVEVGGECSFVDEQMKEIGLQQATEVNTGGSVRAVSPKTDHGG